MLLGYDSVIYYYRVLDGAINSWCQQSLSLCHALLLVQRRLGTASKELHTDSNCAISQALVVFAQRAAICCGCESYQVVEA